MANHQQVSYLGRVLDREKQAPVSGAKVTLNFSNTPIIVYSDLEGIYRFRVRFDRNNLLEGELTIEAKGYQTYRSFIRLSPGNKDLGDIKLAYPHASPVTYLQTSQSETNSALIPVLAAIMLGLALIIAVFLFRPPRQRPVKPQNNRIISTNLSYLPLFSFYK